MPQKRFIRNFAALLTKAAMADGQVSDEETKTIRDYFTTELKFSEDKLKQLDEIMSATMKKDPPVEKLCKSYAEKAPYEERLLTMRLLYHVALADGKIDRSEEALICYMGTLLGLSDTDFTSIWAEFRKDYSRYYDALGLSLNPSKKQVEAAYTAAKKKYDPAKVAHLGPEFEQMAKKKIALIEEAYSYFRMQLGD